VKYPLVLPLAALAAGIALSHYVRFDAREALTAAALSIGLSLLATTGARRLVGICSSLVLLFCGIWIDLLHRSGKPPEIDAGAHETVIVGGCIVEPPAFYEGRDQFVLELAPRARARVTLTIRDGESPPDLHYGQTIELEARVRPVRNFQNPGAFDYQAYEARSDIYWTASAPAGSTPVIQPGSCGSRFWAVIFGLRTAALNRLEQLYKNNAYATGMLEATLIGETRKLEKIWTDHFRRTATYHMLVIDGLHVTVLAACLLFLLRLCFLPELGALALTAAGAWLYALVSGFNAPAVRAAGGFTFYLACRYFYRRGRLLNLLAAMAIIYLLYDPSQLFEAGFQLSFLSVAVIAAIAMPLLDATSAPFAKGLSGITDPGRDPSLPPRAAQFRIELRLLAETLHYYVRLPQDWLAQSLAFVARVFFFAYEIALISTVIQIGLALPMAIYFHRISLSGLSANVIVVPLLALVVPIGFLAVFTNWNLPASLAAWLLGAGEAVANWHLHLEPNWRVADPPLGLSIAFCLALVALAFAISRSRAWGWFTAAAVMALFVTLLLHPFAPAIHRGELELTAIDVGQGDSLLISFPDGKLMLMDGGGIVSFGHHAKQRIDIGEDVVSPYLWSRSIRKIDVVAMTHAHDDHAGGLPALIENFHPQELWTGATPSSQAWSLVQAKARAGNVKLVHMNTGRSFEFGGSRIEVLSPPSDYIAADTPKNNDSLALRITYRERSFLLTGDMERPMEYEALATGAPLRADVLKVGHHGSNTSSTDPFLDAVSPTFAIISDGFDNPFRHPHPQVLQRLEAHHASTFRTDRQGLITIQTDGHRIAVETFHPVSGE